MELRSLEIGRIKLSQSTEKQANFTQARDEGYSVLMINIHTCQPR